MAEPDPKPVAELPRVIVTGIVLGITAAAVVWFLERFQTNRLVTELRQHLDEQSEEYREWLAQRPNKGGLQ